MLGFPSNDFGGQEPGSSQEIAKFCTSIYAVNFPMFEKTSVKKGGDNKLFQRLIEVSGTTPKWNFYKYLLDREGRPTITNVSFTLYDHYSGKIQYNFVHAMNEKGNPDTLFLDPVGIYDFELHTVPSIRKENIELVPGKHNIIAMDAVYGNLNVECISASIANNDAQILVRQKNGKENIFAYFINYI